MPLWKPLPRAVGRLKRRQKTDRDVERTKTKVRQRDGYRCRVCGRRTYVVHEHKTRGAGGLVSLDNSLCACDVLDGGLCHPLLQRHLITPVRADGSDDFDAQEDLVFEMTEKIAVIAFEQRPRPAHVRIVEE